MIRTPPAFILLALSATAILILAGCTPSHPQSTFDPAGPIADKQLDLFIIIFWAAVGVFVLVTGALLYTVIRYRRRQGQEEIPPQTHGNTPVEVAWTIAPVIVLAIIAVPTIIYIFDIADTPPDSMEVHVTGHQWWWEFEYPEQNVITANELHVPVDKPIKLVLRSDDVIHSFWIPKLAGKVDVIPSNENPMRFTAEKTGTFFGQCAEFCGVAHAHMRFRVIVETEEGFNAWVDNYRELAARPPPSSGPAAEGATLFASRGCLLCHTASGPAPADVRQSLAAAFERGELRFPAPNLTNFGTRTTLAAGIMELNRDNLVEWLRDPDEVKPGNRMGRLANVYVDPKAELSEDDISALTEYLLSLK